MDFHLEFPWWFNPFCLFISVIVMFGLGLFLLFVFGLIFAFSYLVSFLLLKLLEPLQNWQPSLQKRTPRRDVICLAIFVFVALLASAKFLEFRQVAWDYLLMWYSFLSEWHKIFTH